MTERATVANGLNEDALAPRRGTAAKFARSLVRRQLGALGHGTLHVRDPWGDWQCGRGGPEARLGGNRPDFYSEVLFDGSLGAARSWFERGWDSDDVVGVLRLMVRNIDVLDSMEGGLAFAGQLVARARHALRRNSKRRARQNIEAHYDLGNAFFSQFLDHTMTYSCALFENEDSPLEAAQTAKLERMCSLVGLTAKDHVLEIGTGWGSFALHAAREYGCKVTTTTISPEQHKLARQRIEAAGLSEQVSVLLEDYRELPARLGRRFDKVVSIEMIEAVGHEYLPAFFETCSALLHENGAMALQAITMPGQRYHQYLKSSDFIQQHIFPGSCCPSLNALLDAIAEASDLRVSRVEDIAPHYAQTLERWRTRLESQWGQMRELGFDDEFLRRWEYYFAYCEAGFAERYTGTVQMLLEKPRSRVGSAI